MGPVQSPGPEHDNFLIWAHSQGVTINGLEPARFPGSGLGVVATKPLKQGDLLVSVPAKVLLTIEKKEVKHLKLPIEATVHGRLAAYLTLMHGREDRPYKTWQEVWPKREDFDAIMPLRWQEQEKLALPEHVKELLSKQQTKIDLDWALLKSYLPNHNSSSCRDLFTYYWLIINTRTFYWDYPAATRSGKHAPKRRKLVPDDCMALCPFMEYFNHADQGCAVDHDVKGFTVKCDRDYDQGQEVYLSYGSHSNDFLLVEYGFILTTNKWDETRLDHIILPKLSKAQKDMLNEAGFLNKYIIDATQTCHRTQVALRLLILPTRQWRQFVEGRSDGAKDQVQVDEYCVRLLQQYEREIDMVENRVNDLEEGDRKATLAKRWTQIRDIIGALRAKLEE